ISPRRNFSIPMLSAKATVLRSFLVRFFFYTSLAIWLYNGFTTAISISFINQCSYTFAIISIVAPIALTELEFLLRDC
ncbi:MAG: hypothetical protein QW279_03025, partial [Candidatus Jordarchaeaceae archaeon]